MCNEENPSKCEGLLAEGWGVYTLSRLKITAIGQRNPPILRDLNGSSRLQPVGWMGMEIEGKRILISGATGGLGIAISHQLASEGASLVLSARSAEALDRLASQIPGGTARHTVIETDLTEPDAPERLIAASGDLDGLVANAALPGTGKLESFSDEQLRRALRVNFEVPLIMARELAPKLAAKGEGHLVFIASLAGKVASPRGSLYSSTKFGLRGLAFGLREDLRPEGIGVSVVSPGFVRDAGMFHDTGSEAPAVLGTTTPEKVARAVSKAIHKDRSEVTVAPIRQRIAAEIGYRHPEWAGRVQRVGGAEGIVGELEDRQAEKR